jgi:hypothetical protein
VFLAIFMAIPFVSDQTDYTHCLDL